MGLSGMSGWSGLSGLVGTTNVPTIPISAVVLAIGDTDSNPTQIQFTATGQNPTAARPYAGSVNPGNGAAPITFSDNLTAPKVVAIQYGGGALQTNIADEQYLGLASSAPIQIGAGAFGGVVTVYANSMTVNIGKWQYPNFEWLFDANVTDASFYVCTGSGGAGLTRVYIAYDSTIDNTFVWWYDPVAQTINVNVNNSGSPASLAFTGTPFTSTAEFAYGMNDGNFTTGTSGRFLFFKPPTPIAALIGDIQAWQESGIPVGGLTNAQMTAWNVEIALPLLTNSTIGQDISPNAFTLTNNGSATVADVDDLTYTVTYTITPADSPAHTAVVTPTTLSVTPVPPWTPQYLTNGAFYMPFAASPTSTQVDVIGGNNATPTATLTSGTGPNSQPALASAASGYLTLAEYLFTGNAAPGISLWVNTATGGSGFEMVFGCGTDDSDRFFLTSYGGSAEDQIYLEVNPSYVIFSNNVTTTLGTLTHYFIQIWNGYIWLFKNWVMQGGGVQATGGLDPSQLSGTSLLFNGQSHEGPVFNGTIAEPAVIKGTSTTGMLAWEGRALYDAAYPLATNPQQGPYYLVTFDGVEQEPTSMMLRTVHGTDGVNFVELPQQYFLISGGQGTVRDPDGWVKGGKTWICYTNCGKSDGTFATTTSFGVGYSSDGLNWLTAANIVPGIALTAVIFAPNHFTDPASGNEYFVWANGPGPAATTPTLNMAIYIAQITDTTGYTTIGTPTLITLSGVGGIDGVYDPCLVYKSGTYYLFFKQGGVQYCGLATASSLAGPWTVVYDGSTNALGFGPAEGPTVYANNSGVFEVVFDQLDGGGDPTGLATMANPSGDLVTWTNMQTIVVSSYLNPTFTPRHGCVIPILD